jgi:hypothetical protein
MYKEAMTLSEEVLEVFPGDEAAIANAKAAKNSLTFRSKGMAQAVPMVSPLLCRNASTRCVLLPAPAILYASSLMLNLWAKRFHNVSVCQLLSHSRRKRGRRM